MIHLLFCNVVSMCTTPQRFHSNHVSRSCCEPYAFAARYCTFRIYFAICCWYSSNMICPLRSWSKPMIERSERLPAGKLVLLLRELVHPEPSEVNRGAELFLVPSQDLDALPSYSASFTLYVNLCRCAIASIDKMLYRCLPYRIDRNNIVSTRYPIGYLLNQCNIVSICIDAILHQ
jgi:hypothetical protein